MVAGVLKPQQGEILVDGGQVYDRLEVKKKIYFISDDPYFFANCNPVDMQKYLCSVYPEFAVEDFYSYLMNFGLDKKRKVNTYSKGMRKQLALICGVCSGAKYLLCDETFDGLDPIARNIAKRLIYRDMCDFGSTVILTSHSLRELEDTCDRFAMLYQGKIVFQNDLADAKSQLFKVQLAFARQVTPEDFKDVELLSFTKQGSIVYVLVRGEAAETSAKIEALKPLIMDMLPLSIEEVFTYELSSLGYNFDEIK